MQRKDIIKAGNNWYDYCGGNPLGFIDPLGLDRFPNIDIDAWRSQSQMANREPRQQQSFGDWYDGLPNWGQYIVQGVAVVTIRAAAVATTVITAGKAAPLIVSVKKIVIGNTTATAAVPVLVSNKKLTTASVIGGGAISAGTNLGFQTNAFREWDNVDQGSVIRSGLLGVVSGFFGASTFGIGSQIMLNSMLGGASYVLDVTFSEEDFTLSNLVILTAPAAVAALVSEKLPKTLFRKDTPSVMTNFLRETFSATLVEILEETINNIFFNSFNSIIEETCQ